MRASDALAAAVRHHQAGDLAQAERFYRKALADDPKHLQALHLAAALALQTARHEEALELIRRALALNEQAPEFHYNGGLALWALQRRAEAMAHWARAVQLNPNFGAAHMNLGLALREAGDLAAAETHLRRVMQLQPQSPQAHNNLGLVLAARGDRDAALHYQRAIDLQPGFIEAYLNLAVELALAGRVDQALACLRRSLEIRELPDNKALFARVIGMLDPSADHGALRPLVTRATTEGWGQPQSLAPLAAALVMDDGPAADFIARAAAAWPALLPAGDLLGPSGLTAVADAPLLLWLLESALITDIRLERFLTACRATLLEIAESAQVLDAAQLRFACALARQCYVNEYVYAASNQERARAEQLRDALAAALASGAAVPSVWIAVAAAYEPLHALPNAEALLAGPRPPALAALLAQQISQPKDDARCRALVPQLTPIDDDVSRLVQRQYEENPYPRWVTVGLPQKYDSIDMLMRREFPYAPYRPQGDRADFDILIAGCGTGQHSIGVAQQFERAHVLAIDLSAASLGYALARTRALGVSNVRYGQADILKLDVLGRSFDVIQAAGVLHHLADPWTGWRTLLARLRPNGCMYVALYSEIARRDVVAARAFIAERRYGATAAEIRACRQELAASEPGTPLHNVSKFRDFFTLSECRDLLFHVQEHRMTLPIIKEFLAANGLQFLGFDLDFRLLQQYAARFPHDKAMIDLDQWDVFERDNPDTFVAMYKFWVQRAVA